MTTNFDRWESDPFFSAAEEVQDSADRLESAYRNWLAAQDTRASKNAPFEAAEESSEIVRRELQTALGTAKWQLDEFEKAVKSTYSEKSASAKMRHNHFVFAIKNQISGIEKALNDSCHDQNKRGLRWVRLNDEEKDDLAHFLCGSEDKGHSCRRNTDAISELQGSKITRRGSSEDFNVSRGSTGNASGFKETILVNRDSKFVVEMSEQNLLDSTYDGHSGASTEKKYDSRPVANEGADICSWKIFISDDNDEECFLESQYKESGQQFNIWNTGKKGGIPGRLKWSKSGVKNEKNPGHDLPAISKTTNLVCGWAASVQRRLQRSQHLFQYGRSLHITWILLVLLCFMGLFTIIAN
eukprot:TRINITY_DN40186_c0_g1_i1.p1 TRINITY_DN40186_c0_g1~~TRINITY_DN40186_c0_g1_i1.p1  ORF type:complete len:355 (+),score=54.01 TRINITY_DN40186_c0_g1_i1:368-1432(+)